MSSDFICSYKIENQLPQSLHTSASSYFIMERNVSFLQFTQFLNSSSIIDDSFSIYSSNQLINSEESFRNLLHSLNYQQTIEFLFISNNPIDAQANNQPENEKIPQEKLSEDEFGEILKSIAQKIGMNLNKIPERARELVESIPFPHKCIVRQFIRRVRQNPSELEAIIQQAASFYSVDGELLLKDVQQVIQFYKERIQQKACEKKEKDEEKQENKQENPIIGQNLQKILKEFQVDHSKVKSAEDFDKIIGQLPHPMNKMVTMKLNNISQHPNRLNWISKKLSQRFKVPEEELKEELKEIANKYVEYKGRNSEKQENEEVNSQKVDKFHAAVCDGCKNRIKGTRYWCLNCKNYDLCSDCEEKNVEGNIHEGKHIFAKIKDANTPYRVFPGVCEGIRGRFHPKLQRNARKFQTEAMDARLTALEENVKLLKENLQNIL